MSTVEIVDIKVYNLLLLATLNDNALLLQVGVNYHGGVVALVHNILDFLKKSHHRIERQIINIRGE